jgi:hypothetical protein
VEPCVNANRDVRGLALLVRKGMAAWMHALSQPSARPAAARPRSDESPSKRIDAAAPAERRAAGIE